MWKLRDWIKESCLNRLISLNPRAMGYLKEHPNLIEWTFLSENPEAIDLLTKSRQDKLGHIVSESECDAPSQKESRQDLVEVPILESCSHSYARKEPG